VTAALLIGVLILVMALAVSHVAIRDARQARHVLMSQAQTIIFLQRALGHAERGAKEAAARLSELALEKRLAGELWGNLRAAGDAMKTHAPGNDSNIAEAYYAATRRLDELHGWRGAPPDSLLRAVELPHRKAGGV
jgi:hypothetical protein